MRNWTVAAVAGLLLVAGCDRTGEPTPEQACSAPATYDQLIALIAAQIAQAGMGARNPLFASSSSARALGRVASFVMPTVEGVDRDTRKITCAAMMQVTVPAALQPGLNTGGLQVNEVAGDRLQVRVTYALQPAADSGRQVATLDQAADVALLAMQASMIATRRLQDAAGTAPPSDMATPANAVAADADANEPAMDGLGPYDTVPDSPAAPLPMAMPRREGPDPDEVAADRVTAEVNARRERAEAGNE